MKLDKLIQELTDYQNKLGPDCEVFRLDRRNNSHVMIDEVLVFQHTASQNPKAFKIVLD